MQEVYSANFYGNMYHSYTVMFFLYALENVGFETIITFIDVNLSLLDVNGFNLLKYYKCL